MEELRDIRTRSNAALTPVGKELGIEIFCGNISFRDVEATMKVELKKLSIGGESQEALDFKQLAPLYDLGDALGKTFIANGKLYRIIGWKRRGRTKPILVEEGGKHYIMSIEDVKLRLKAPAASTVHHNLTKES